MPNEPPKKKQTRRVGPPRAQHPPGLAVKAYNTQTLFQAGGTALSLTQEIHDGLYKAIKTHPTMETAAHSQGVSLRCLQNWIRRGSLPGADPRLVAFTAAFAAARAEVARENYEEYNRAIKDGEPALAAAIDKQICRRFPERDPGLIENAISGSAKRSDSLEELLLNPTARLLGLLQKTGWVRKEGWNHAGVITTAGEPKAGD